MENHNEGIRLFQLIKNKTDEQTALSATSAIQGAIKAEVKYETANAIRDVKIELLGKISDTELSLIERISATELRLIDRINNVKADLLELKSDLLDKFFKNSDHPLDRWYEYCTANGAVFFQIVPSLTISLKHKKAVIIFITAFLYF